MLVGGSGTERDLSRPPSRVPLSERLSTNVKAIKALLGESPDVEIRLLEAGVDRTPIAVVYTSGIVDTRRVNQFVDHFLQKDTTLTSDPSAFAYVKACVMASGEAKTIRDRDSAVLSILSGETVVFVHGSDEAVAFDTRGGDKRHVEEPSSQVVIRGPKEGFTESIGTNVALIRRRIRTPNLRLELVKIGRQTQTDVCMMYIEGIADDGVVRSIRKRLRAIDTDAVLGSGYIEQMIEDFELTPFPTIYNTERPDSVAGNLLEGRVAIVVDGTPFVLVAPVTFFMFFQATEDYYQRPIAATAIRLLRYGAFLISLFGPSIYVAAITFHQEMIPTQLLVSLAAQRESVPFPALIEVLVMEITFEILREAGIRMPRAIGQAVSIVGALVIGQAAVEAGIISPAMVIVVSITGISSFSTPSYDMALAIRLLRFSVIMSAAILGFYGIAIVSIIILGHMCGLRSFGVSYMAPLSPFVTSDHKDTFLRLPFRSMFTRPRLIASRNTVRQSTDAGDRRDGEGGSSP